MVFIQRGETTIRWLRTDNHMGKGDPSVSARRQCAVSFGERVSVGLLTAEATSVVRSRGSMRWDKVQD